MQSKDYTAGGYEGPIPTVPEDDPRKSHKSTECIISEQLTEESSKIVT